MRTPTAQLSGTLYIFWLSSAASSHPLHASIVELWNVLMPAGLSGMSALPVFSVCRNVGFAKSLTARLILFATVDMCWDDTTMLMFKKGAASTREH